MPARGGCPAGRRVEAGESLFRQMFIQLHYFHPHEAIQTPTGQSGESSSHSPACRWKLIPVVVPLDRANLKRRIASGMTRRNEALHSLAAWPAFSFTFTLTFSDKFFDRILSRVIIFVLPLTPPLGNQGSPLHPLHEGGARTRLRQDERSFEWRNWGLDVI